MSPLARIRQMAAGILFLFSLPYFAVAAEAQPAPPATAPAATAHPQPAQPVVLAPKSTAQIARSALLVVEGTAADDSLQLKIRRVSDGTAVNGGDVTVTVDGKNEPVTHEKSDMYEVPVHDLRGNGSQDGASDVDIVVAHDGIREILSSKVTVAEASSGGSLLGDHKQMAWWALNIVIVLVAGIAITRRKG
jgi:hypothetical protein